VPAKAGPARERAPSQGRDRAFLRHRGDSQVGAGVRRDLGATRPARKGSRPGEEGLWRPHQGGAGRGSGRPATLTGRRHDRAVEFGVEVSMVTSVLTALLLGTVMLADSSNPVVVGLVAAHYPFHPSDLPFPLAPPSQPP